MANAYEIAKSVVGQTIDFDGAYGGQCADLINYVSQKLGFTLWGNGNQIGLQAGVEAHADVIPYTPGMKLEIGDIISSAAHPVYGHVVVFGGGTLQDALVIEQNYGGRQVVIEHRRNIEVDGTLRIVRFRNQSNYSPSGANSNVNGGKGRPGTATFAIKMFEITCDEVQGVEGIDNPKVVDTFFKCNKVTGELNGDWLIYYRFTGGKGYIPKSCVKELNQEKEETKVSSSRVLRDNEYYDEFLSDGISQEGTQKIYTLGQLIQDGTIGWGNFTWAYLFKDNMPKTNVDTKGFKVNAQGFLEDNDGLLVLAYNNTYGNIQGSIYKTPFGRRGKAYFGMSDVEGLSVFIK